MTASTARVDVETVHREGRVKVEVNGTPVVVFSLGDEFVAYVDECAHLGGPVCSEGSLHPFYTARVRDDGRVEPYFADGGEQVVACPWHGWEYDLNSGRCLADGARGLKAATVDRDGGQLIVSL